MIFGREDYDGGDINKIVGKDEPVFLMRGHDKYAGPVLDFLAGLMRADKGETPTLHSLLTHRERMLAWPTRKKGPDAPAIDFRSLDPDKAPPADEADPAAAVPEHLLAQPEMDSDENKGRAKRQKSAEK